MIGNEVSSQPCRQSQWAGRHNFHAVCVCYTYATCPCYSAGRRNIPKAWTSSAALRIIGMRWRNLSPPLSLSAFRPRMVSCVWSMNLIRHCEGWGGSLSQQMQGQHVALYVLPAEIGLQRMTNQGWYYSQVMPVSGDSRLKRSMQARKYHLKFRSYIPFPPVNLALETTFVWSAKGFHCLNTDSSTTQILLSARIRCPMFWPATVVAIAPFFFKKKLAWRIAKAALCASPVSMSNIEVHV